ncbi:putative membrane protein [Marininema mesophilum]|uniref:Putative membrane protein n=1 Tax=Marininema mesophilum TaxID=1048340 RepID=A0A1H2TMJ3_9BACL|nr:phage holin family protein [Marininema mesophilum]SDW45173.1 putative membrane protein [Marininema mesophilum]
MGWIVKLLLNGLAVVIVANVIPGIYVQGFLTALLVALVLGFVNTFIRPILVFLTLPISFFTLGLFIFILNAVLFKLTSMFIPGFEVYTFWAALLGSIVISIVSWLLNGIWRGLRN